MTTNESSPDRIAGKAPGPGDVIYNGHNTETLPFSAEPFRPAEAVEAIDPNPKRPSGTEGRGHGIETIVPTADARAEHGAGFFEQEEPVEAKPDPVGHGVLGDPPSAHTVPAGREGVDSGPVDSVSVEGGASPDVEANSQNDIAGVGPRDAGDVSTGGDGPTDPAAREDLPAPDTSNAAGDAGTDPAATREAPTAHDSADPDIPGVPDAIGPGGNGLQTEPLQDQNDTSLNEQEQGIVVQVQGDLQTGRAPEGQARELLAQRLTQAGLDASPESLDRLLRQIGSSGAPTDVDEAQPGADR